MSQFGQPPGGNPPGEQYGQDPADQPPQYQPPQYQPGPGQGQFGQGQPGQGQFGQGQPGQGQFGQGQSGGYQPGQFPAGSSQPGQYAPTEQYQPGQQFPAGQFQNPNQYPPAGQYPGSGQYPSAPPFQETAPGGARLASWWRRVGATLIDGIITSFVAVVLGIVIQHNSRYWLAALVGLIYTVGLLGSRNRTLGNDAVSTVTIRDDGSTGPIGYGKAFVRWLVQEVLAITVIGGILDILWPLWDKQNQTLHDKAAKTLVIMK